MNMQKKKKLTANSHLPKNSRRQPCTLYTHKLQSLQNSVETKITAVQSPPEKNEFETCFI